MLNIIDRYMKIFEEWFLVIGIAIMGIIMSLQVFCRLFIHALTWSEEVSKYIFVWVVFVGMSYGFITCTHISLDLFVQKFPIKTQHKIRICVDLFCMFVLLYLFKPSVDYMLFQKTQMAATIPINMGYVAASMPISIILTCLSLIIDINKVRKEDAK